MACSSLLLVATFLLVFFIVFAEPSPAMDSSVTTAQSSSSSTLQKAIDCGAACQYRCSKSSRPNLCHRACGTCCKRCNCVPPGTYGNQYMCPCYAALTTHGGRRKCP